jgi:hypothetical protein
LEAAAHLFLTELARELVVLDDREAKLVRFAQEQRPSLGAREPAGLGEDALEEGSQVLLAGQSDPDLDELSERLRHVQRRSLRLLQGSAPATVSAVRIGRLQELHPRKTASHTSAIYS